VGANEILVGLELEFDFARWLETHSDRANCV
jgi:hypothetical protein